MSKFTDNASEKLLVVAGKISNQKHMASIKNAFYTLMPVILTGAFCTLISNVVCSTTTTGISLAKLPGMSWLGMFTDLFTAANYATLNFFTVAAVFLIGMELAKQNGLGDSPDSGVVAVCSFISVFVQQHKADAVLALFIDLQKAGTDGHIEGSLILAAGRIAADAGKIGLLARDGVGHLDVIVQIGAVVPPRRCQRHCAVLPGRHPCRCPGKGD